jgi:undecaprenyl-diphosphatase
VLTWDYRLEQWINGPAGTHPAWDTLMRGTAAAGEAIFIAVVILWFLVGWLYSGAMDRQSAITALLGAGVALLVNVLISHVWLRTRPFMAHSGTVHVLLTHSKDASFPSDHASAAFAISFVLLAAHRRLGALALAFAVLMSYARVYVGDHYPGDVLAGAVIGLAVACVFLSWLRPVMAGLRTLGDRVIVALRLPLALGPADA